MFYYYNELTTDLTTTECMLYSFIHAIYYRRMQQGEQRSFYGSNNFISEQLGISRRTVIETLKTLEKKKYIKIHYSPDKTKRLIVPKLVNFEDVFQNEGGAKFAPGVVQNLQGGSAESALEMVQNLHPNNNINNNLNNNLNNTHLDSVTAAIPQNDIGWTEEKISAANDMIDEHNIEYRWNMIADEFGLKKCRCVTKTRISHYQQRIKDIGGAEDLFWDTIRAALVQSDFLRGKNNRAWKANLDFFLRQSSYVKAAEGAYSNAKTGLVNRNTAPIEQAANGEKLTSEKELVDLFWKM